MKLHILSDLHLEVSMIELPEVGADILVLAGDIATGTMGIEFAKKYSNKYKHILYVMGNHEFYGHHLSKMSKQIKDTALDFGKNIHVLDNNTLILDKHIFIGSTLWTDFQLYGKDLKTITACMNSAGQSINDFSQIRYANSYFHPSYCAQMCLINKIFISDELKKYSKQEYEGYKKVVITHYTPSAKSIPQKYANQIINAYFSNNMDTLVEKSDIWIHGHTHTSFDYKIKDSRVICNPRGYSKYQDKQENMDFNLKFVIEI